MMRKHCKYYICLLGLLLVSSLQTFSQGRVWSENLLGSGGSNYSRKSERKISRNNGLRTGQYSGEHHLFGMYVEGAYSCMFNTLPNVTYKPGGYDVGGGLVYEYQNSSFILQTGIGISWQDIKVLVSDTTFTKYNTPDSWTNQRDTFHYDLKYEFYRRGDVSKILYAQVPFLCGMTLGGWYFHAGLKFNMALIGQTKVSAVGTTTGTYDRYFGIFQEMDNHGLRKDVPIERKGEMLKLKFDVLASAETGYEWATPEKRGYKTTTSNDWRFRIAAFVNVGLLNISPSTNKDFIYIPENYRYDFPKYQFNHVFSTNHTKNSTLHNFFVGLKLTILYGFQAPERCIICGPFDTEADMANPFRRRN